MLKSLKRAGIDDVGGITTLTERCIGNLNFKDGSHHDAAALLKELSEGCQQLTLRFIACVKIQLDDGMMVHEDWQNLVIKTEFQDF